MKPYQDHSEIDDQGKAAPLPKKPNGYNGHLRPHAYYIATPARWNAAPRGRPTRSVRRAAKQGGRMARVAMNELRRQFFRITHGKLLQPPP